MLRRMHTVFIRAKRRWIHYTTSYREGGSTCVPELSEDKVRVCEATPCHTMFAESTFGVLDDVVKVGGPRMAPHRAAHTAMSRKNARFTAPRDMTENEGISARCSAKSLELQVETQKHTRSTLWLKKDSGKSKKDQKPKGNLVDPPEVKYRGTKPPKVKGSQGPSRSSGRAHKPNPKYQ